MHKQLKRRTFFKQAGLVTAGLLSGSLAGETKPVPEQFTAIKDLPALKSGTEVLLIGKITVLREITTRRGTSMAFSRFKDESSSIEMVIFPDRYHSFKARILADRQLVVAGTIEKSDEESKFICDGIYYAKS